MTTDYNANLNFTKADTIRNFRRAWTVQETTAGGNDGNFSARGRMAASRLRHRLANGGGGFDGRAGAN